MTSPFEALMFQAGYNAGLVAIGTTLLGIAAGVTGAFLFLRKRALISDAVAHATLPGIGLAFISMVALGLDGRHLIFLMLGGLVTAVMGFFVVEWISRHTRLAEDAAIGAVLSVFFGFGVVLLTVIQTLSAGRQAGLEGFLLGSTAGMLFQDAIVILIGGLIAVTMVVLLRRPMTLISFDPEYAQSYGLNVRTLDLVMVGLVTAVTVIGLKVVGLILIVALLIIPAVAARFWTNRTDRVVLVAAVIGGASGYIGSALSVSAPSLPTGPIIVLVCFALFVASLLFAPNRGALASVARQRRFQLRVHRRQGLLAIAHDEPVFDRLTLAVLRRAGFICTDGVPTDTGRAQATKALRDERRWDIVREVHKDVAIVAQYDGLTSIETVLTQDEIVEIDRVIRPPKEVSD